MPTAAKLVAAIAFAAVAFLAAEAFKPEMPEWTMFGAFSFICAGFGAFCGWRISGRNAGRGWRVAMGVGLTSALATVVLVLGFFSIREMLIRSMNRRFDGPLEAAVGTFGIALEYGALMLAAPVLGILLIGGILGGLLAEVAARRWN